MNALALSGSSLRRSFFAMFLGMHLICAGIDVFVYWRSPLVQLFFVTVALFNTMRPPLDWSDD